MSSLGWGILFNLCWSFPPLRPMDVLIFYIVHQFHIMSTSLIAYSLQYLESVTSCPMKSNQVIAWCITAIRQQTLFSLVKSESSVMMTVILSIWSWVTQYLHKNSPSFIHEFSHHLLLGHLWIYLYFLSYRIFCKQFPLISLTQLWKPTIRTIKSFLSSNRLSWPMEIVLRICRSSKSEWEWFFKWWSYFHDLLKWLKLRVV